MFGFSAVTRRRLLLAASMVLAGILAAPFAQAETLMEKIKKRGKLIVATETAYPPWEFIKDGKIVGYGKDILDYIVADLKVELEQLDLPFQGILPGLLVGKYDFVATAIGVNPERAQKYALTMPLAVSRPAVLKRKGDTRIAKLEDLAGKSVGTLRASTSEQTAKVVDDELKAKGLGGLKELKLFQAYPEAYLSLANRSLDAVMNADITLNALMKERPGTYEIALQIDDKRYTGWAVRAEDKDFRDYINAKIVELIRSGKLYQMQETWFGFKMEIPESGYLPPGAV